MRRDRRGQPLVEPIPPLGALAQLEEPICPADHSLQIGEAALTGARCARNER